MTSKRKAGYNPAIGTYAAGRSNANRGKRLPPEPLTQDEVLRLLGTCSSRAPTAIRNRALIVVLWRAGLRISESLALRPSDMDANAGTIRVRHGKGDKCRVVGFDDWGFGEVQKWISARKALRISSRKPLFCTLRGDPVQAAYVRNVLPRLAVKAGIDKRVHPHGLRHSHACDLRRERMDIAVISQQLGHAAISTTSRYLQHLHPGEVIDAIASREAPSHESCATR